MDAQTYRDLQSGAWALRVPRLCPCGGLGWFLSDFDTYHRCPLHGRGVPHPEDFNVAFDADEHLLQMNREAFAGFRAEAREAGFTGSFNAACRVRLPKHPTPTDWVEIAQAVTEEAVFSRRDADARRQGYSCDRDRQKAKDLLVSYGLDSQLDLF